MRSHDVEARRLTQPRHLRLTRTCAGHRGMSLATAWLKTASFRSRFLMTALAGGTSPLRKIRKHQPASNAWSATAGTTSRPNRLSPATAYESTASALTLYSNIAARRPRVALLEPSLRASQHASPRANTAAPATRPRTSAGGPSMVMPSNSLVTRAGANINVTPSGASTNAIMTSSVRIIRNRYERLGRRRVREAHRVDACRASPRMSGHDRASPAATVAAAGDSLHSTVKHTLQATARVWFRHSPSSSRPTGRPNWCC